MSATQGHARQMVQQTRHYIGNSTTQHQACLVIMHSPCGPPANFLEYYNKALCGRGESPSCIISHLDQHMGYHLFPVIDTLFRELIYKVAGRIRGTKP